MGGSGMTETNVVYVIGSDASTRVKIGLSDNINRRLMQIQRMSPVDLRVLWQTAGDAKLEKWLHCHFDSRRTHGEWFDFADEDPVALIRGAVGEIQTTSNGIDDHSERVALLVRQHASGPGGISRSSMRRKIAQRDREVLDRAIKIAAMRSWVSEEGCRLYGLSIPVHPSYTPLQYGNEES